MIDLCYEHLIYDDVAHNLPRVAAEHARARTVLVGSASKSWSMTGWRCGWAIGPAALLEAADVVQGHATTNVSSITQRAVLAALTGPDDDVRAMLDEYRRRPGSADSPGWRTSRATGSGRRPVRSIFFRTSRSCCRPTASGHRRSSQCGCSMRHTSALTPGEAFDAPGFLRLSYAASSERLAAGAERLKRFAANLG